VRLRNRLTLICHSSDTARAEAKPLGTANMAAVDAAKVVSKLGAPRCTPRRVRQGISAWVARVVLTCLRDDIVRAFKSAAAQSLSVNGIRGRLEPTLRSRPAAAVGWVSLCDVWKELEGEIGLRRDAKPTVWMWAEVPCHAVKHSTSGTPA